MTTENVFAELDHDIAEPLRNAGIPEELINKLMQTTGCYTLAWRVGIGERTIVQLKDTDLRGMSKRNAWVMDGGCPTGFEGLDNVYEIEPQYVNRSSALIVNYWEIK